MAQKTADRVRETTTTTGTGSIALTGAVTGYQSFSSVLITGDTTYYCVADQGGANWEVGIGTFTSPSTLARTTILSSSNSGSIVTFTTGSKDVFITEPAAALTAPIISGGTIDNSVIGGITPAAATVSSLTLGGYANNKKIFETTNNYLTILNGNGADSDFTIDANGSAAVRGSLQVFSNLNIGGVVATGTWNGTAIAILYGGTGAATAAGARTNLGLGGAAVLNVGTTAGTVAAGDDSRITGALSTTAAASTYAPLVSPALTGTPVIGGINAAVVPLVTPFTSGINTFTKRSTSTVVQVLAVGGGGGGGFGGSYNPGTTGGSGGGGGGGAGAILATFRASDLASSETVTVGAGGAGGLASLVTTAASGTGTTATLLFSGSQVVVVGSLVVVAGVTPTGYNGTYTVTASSAGSVSYINATTGAQTVAGTIGVTPSGGTIAGQGARGGITSFGTKLYAAGGGGGAPGVLGSASGGGGGMGSTNNQGSFGTNSSGGGGTFSSVGGFGAVGNAQSFGTVGMGTGGGGCTAIGAAFSSGASTTALTGGGSGGGFNASAVAQAGAASGITSVAGTVTSGAAGAVATAGGAGVGATAQIISSQYAVTGGGGGGAGSAANGGAGGAGGSYGGGGGGGGAGDSSLSRVGGYGGAGGAGFVIVVEW